VLGGWCAEDHLFSVDGLVGAMREEEGAATAATDAPARVVTSEVVQRLAPHLDGDVIRYIPGSSAAPTPKMRVGLTTVFMTTKLVDHLPFACWFSAKLLGIVVLVFSSILRFARDHPYYAFSLFIALALPMWAWNVWEKKREKKREEKRIEEEAARVVPLVWKELAEMSVGDRVQRKQVRDSLFLSGLDKKVWKTVERKIERNSCVGVDEMLEDFSSKRYETYWVIDHPVSHQ